MCDGQNKRCVSRFKGCQRAEVRTGKAISIPDDVWTSLLDRLVRVDEHEWNFKTGHFLTGSRRHTLTLNSRERPTPPACPTIDNDQHETSQCTKLFLLTNIPTAPPTETRILACQQQQSTGSTISISNSSSSSNSN
jgi:hypothetical protein